jgi:small subunit ribosomal protein S6
MSSTKEYEVLYILAPDLDEDRQKKMMDAVVGVIEKTGAEILKNDVWGRRRLAYPIKKHTDGVYVLVRCKATPSMPKALDVFIKRTPEILRHLTTLVTKQQLKEEARQRGLETKRMEEVAKREAEAVKRAEEAAQREAEKAAQKEAEEAQASESTDAASSEPDGSEPPAESPDSPADEVADEESSE